MVIFIIDMKTIEMNKMATISPATPLGQIKSYIWHVQQTKSFKGRPLVMDPVLPHSLAPKGDVPGSPNTRTIVVPSKCRYFLVA